MNNFIDKNFHPILMAVIIGIVTYINYHSFLTSFLTALVFLIFDKFVFFIAKLIFILIKRGPKNGKL